MDFHEPSKVWLHYGKYLCEESQLVDFELSNFPSNFHFYACAFTLSVGPLRGPYMDSLVHMLPHDVKRCNFANLGRCLNMLRLFDHLTGKSALLCTDYR